ncbi:hypothetical protein C8A03DRAFT_35672 [Achaetomium macrosporum]|uniref:Uncharacterized protein n=1 Tax=Achaetomium macrosporum TaxID=79813 RepID=A0AAN7C7H5_9PEZI|nr:hypothetical protein C8A03DRAFT_35672 [Achaetomium macrosporum]
MSLQVRAASRVNARTLLVKVSPAPSTLTERRAILQVLQRHGEVEVFKKLHDPGHFISVLSHPEKAADIVARSPLQFDYVSQQHDGRGAANSPMSRPSHPQKKTFYVQIKETYIYQHKTHIRENPIHGRWPAPNDSLLLENSMTKAALSQAVPHGMAHAGLVDWATCGQLDGQETLTSKEDHIAARRRRRMNESKFGSLVEAYNARHASGRQREGGHGKGDVQGSDRAADSNVAPS